MAAGDARQVLLRAADRLVVELGCPNVEGPPEAGLWKGAGRGPVRVGILEAEDELLVAKVRRGLERMVAALGAAEQAETAQRLIGAALDGVEMTMRGELLRRRSRRLPALLPTFVFLVAVPIVDQDEAFELSRRTFELVEEVQREL